MAFRLEHPDSIHDDIRRIVDSQAGKASDAIDHADENGVAETVHEVRRRCKKLRAVARIVRKSVDGYGPVNEAFRDAGRLISAPRDAEARLETLDDLVEAVPEGMQLPDVSALRSALVAAASVATEEVASSGRLDEARALVDEGRARAAGWEFDDEGFDALVGGFAKTHKRARKRFEECLEAGTTESRHEWRKRVKYHRYHLRMLQRTAPVLAGAWEDRLHDLTDLLGDDHDLAVLADTLRSDSRGHGGEDVVDAVAVVAEGRRVDLQTRAVALGVRLFSEPDDVVVDRLRGWWDAWKTEGAAPEGTELTDF